MKSELIKIYEQGYKKLLIEKDYIGYHVVYFEYNEPLCSVTTSTYDECLNEFEDMKSQL